MKVHNNGTQSHCCNVIHDNSCNNVLQGNCNDVLKNSSVIGGPTRCSWLRLRSKEHVRHVTDMRHMLAYCITLMNKNWNSIKIVFASLAL